MSEENEQTTVQCDECSEQIPEDDALGTDSGNRVCSDCYRSCEHCEWSATDSADWFSVDDCQWCRGCWESEAFTCERCENCYNANRTDNSYIYNIGTWCEYCRDDYASYCDNCDEYYPDDDGCMRCGDSIGGVHNYSHKPNPVFHGNDPHGLYMGFELEMSFGNTSHTTYNNAVAGVVPLEQDSICYLKSDSSIEGMGFELVTHPHTLGAYQQASGLWNYIEHLRAEHGARSWDTDTCGLHVHVSRASFKSGAHTHRFLSLIYKNPREMMKLAGRKNSRYARFDDVYKPDEWGIPQFNIKDKIHRGYHTERFSAVNTNNDYTLELRFFRGNMKREGIMTALELCHASVEYTRDMSISDVKLGMLKWEWFADWVSANNGLYPNLYVRMSKVPNVSLNNKPLINA